MRSVLVIILLLFSTSNALALSKGKAEEFLNYLSTPDKMCSLRFYNEFKDTELRQLTLTLFVDSCFEKRQFRKIIKIREVPKNCFCAVETAVAYQKTGNEKTARRIFKSVFSRTNRFDEWILTLNAGNSAYLFKPEILRKKVWTAVQNRNFNVAELYLSYLKGCKFYHLLKGVLCMKEGNRKLAEEELKICSQSERFVYLAYLSKLPVEKLYYLRKAVDSELSFSLKEAVSTYVLDRFLYVNREFFGRALKVVKKFDKRLFKEYQIKYNVLNCNVSRAIRELHTLHGKKYRAWEAVLYGKFFGKRKTFKCRGVDFYSLLLSSKGVKVPPAHFPNKKDITDEGIRYLYSHNRCDVIDFIDRNLPSVALAHYLCGNYRKAIEEAHSVKDLNKHPYLLYVLYPEPPVFGNDLLSLSLARQESRFDPSAVSKSGAVGLMQIMPFTGRYIARNLNVENFKVNSLLDAEVNYKFGSFYIRKLVNKFGLFPIAAASYNAGPTRIEKALKEFGTVKTPYDLIIFTDFYIPYRETRNYVKRVLKNYFFYSHLYGRNEWKKVFFGNSDEFTQESKWCNF